MSHRRAGGLVAADRPVDAAPPAAPGRARVRRRPWSGVRIRIVLAFVGLLAAATVITTVGQRALLLNRAVERVDRQLDQETAGFRKLIQEGRDADGNLLALDAGTTLSGRERRLLAQKLLTTFLRQTVPTDREGLYSFIEGRPYQAQVGASVPAGTDRAVLPLAAASDARRGELHPGGERLRYVAVPIVRGGQALGSLVVVEDLGQEERDATDASREAAAIALVVLLITAGVGYLVAGRVLAPLRRLDAAATAITETDLTRRIEVEGHDELAELARTFNAMLDRLETAFASQRALVSDAGHELRTPITIIRGHLELMGEDPRERRETLALVDDELHRMTRLVDDLLTLAKAERPDFLRPEELDLDELVEALAGKVRALGPRDWRVERADPGVVVADRQRLTQAVMNLAANAVHHSAPGSQIALAGVLEGGRARLCVADQGVGIDPADHARVFERFARIGEVPRAEGAGLGLAIVRAIAEAHGGHVELVSARGQGARFELVIPVGDPEGEDGP